MAAPNAGAAAARGVVRDDSTAGQQKAEQDAGLRCAGCGRRIAEGFEFISATAWRQKHDISGKSRMTSVEHVYTCAGQNGCGAMLEMTASATAVRRVSGEFLFLDDERAVGALRRGYARVNPEQAPGEDAQGYVEVTPGPGDVL